MSEPEEEKVVPELPEVPFCGWVFVMLNEDREWEWESEGLDLWERKAGLREALEDMEAEPVFTAEDEEDE